MTDIQILRQSARYKQGEFTNLCGVYAILNALHELLGRDGFKYKAAKRLYKEMLIFIEAEFGLYATMKDGLTAKELRKLTRFAARMVKELTGKTIDVERLTPKTRKDFVTTLEELDAYKVAIIGEEGKFDHWTIAVGVKDGAVQLKDPNVFRENVTVDAEISKKHVRRKERSKEVIYLIANQTILLKKAS